MRKPATLLSPNQSLYCRQSLKRIENLKPSFKVLWEYWQGQRTGRAIPETTLFQPSAVARHLKDMVVFDVISPSEIRYRVAGTAVVDQMGHDPTGENLLALMDGDLRESVAILMLTICQKPASAYARYTSEHASGKRVVVESLFLPLDAGPHKAPRVIAIHETCAILGYREPRHKTLIGSNIEAVEFLDIGAGMPGGPPPSVAVDIVARQTSLQDWAGHLKPA